MSLVVVVLLSPSLCRLHHTFCIPAPCSPSSNSHILSLLGIVTVICVSPYPMHSPAQLLYCHYKHTPPPRLIRSIFPPPISYTALCCIHYILHRWLRSTRMSFFAVCCVWIRQGLAYLTQTCAQSLHSKTAHGVPTPPALSPIPVFSLHNLGLPTEFIHCPIYHAHTCVQP